MIKTHNRDPKERLRMVNCYYCGTELKPNEAILRIKINDKIYMCEDHAKIGNKKKKKRLIQRL